MADYSIKLDLLSAGDQRILQELNVEFFNAGITFHRRLSFAEMKAVGQIIFDLTYRINDEENLINFAIGDWINQADEWFGVDVGIKMGLRIVPTSHHSCFLSYSHRDEEFAKRLYGRLRAANISVWRAPEDIQGGKKLYDQIEKAITNHDKLLLVLSEASLKSEWVMTEIRKARLAEVKDNSRKLFPVRLVDMSTIREWKCFDADRGKDLAVEVREYYIPDFTEWRDIDKFQDSFARLLDDLKKG